MLRIIKSARPATIILALCTLLSASLVFAAVEDQIRARIQPAGEVCVMGTACAASLGSTATAAGGTRSGADIYQASCFACHGTGANNAPVLGNAEHWAPRLEKGRDVLFSSLTSGFNNNAMPAKGLCMDCSDDELNAVLDHMLQAVQ